MRQALSLPFQHDLEALVSRLVRRYTGGRDTLLADEVGELAWGVSRLWEGFTGGRSLAGQDYLDRPELLDAYLLYYLPRSYVQGRLALRHLAGQRIASMLDLGCGPGSLVLAASDALSRPEAWALDRDARALRLAEELTGAHSVEARLPDLPGAVAGRTFDLVTLGLVVNELFKGSPLAPRDRARWILERVWPRVAPGGHLVIVEPALKATGREALELRDLLVSAGLHVVAPCSRQERCPALEKERDWCHAGLKLEAPAPLQAIGRAVGIDAGDLRFTYFVFHHESGPVEAPQERLRVVSDPMLEKGRAKIWVCGPGGRRLVDRQEKHRTELNLAFDSLARDDLISLDGAESRKEGTRITEETRVTRLQTATGA